MLQRLHIRNYALIEVIDIQFSNHLNILTGETGAGKSIILGALGIILGKRADTKVLADDTKKAIVEATYVDYNKKIDLILAKHSLDIESQLVIRREILPSGKSRAFVNDTPTQLTVLKELGIELIHLHQQFDTSEINSLEYQLSFVDIVAQNEKLLHKYQLTLQEYKNLNKELKQILQSKDRQIKDLDYLNFQYEELSNLALIPEEQEEIEKELSFLKNAEQIKEILSSSTLQLSDEDTSIVSRLQEINRSLDRIKEFDPSISEAADALYSAQLEISERTDTLLRVNENLELDPQRIELLEDRINTIFRLQQKHSVNSITELLTIQENLRLQLDNINNFDEKIAELEAKTSKALDQTAELAQQLKIKRAKVFPKIEQETTTTLFELAMHNAQFKITSSELDDFDEYGKEEIQFLFSANKGSSLKQLSEVASGGELSRVALALKSIIAKAFQLPTLIFDEIDSGVSGDVAGKVGAILKHLSSNIQIITITHTPQVASQQGKHFYIYKEDTELRTISHIKPLSDEERIREIATMLSGNPPSDFALKNAADLLQE